MLKVSGEALAGPGGACDPDILQAIATEIKEATSAGVQVRPRRTHLVLYGMVVGAMYCVAVCPSLRCFCEPDILQATTKVASAGMQARAIRDASLLLAIIHCTTLYVPPLLLR